MTITATHGDACSPDRPLRRRFRRLLPFVHIAIASVATLCTAFSVSLLVAELGRDERGSFSPHRWAQNPVYQFLVLPGTGFELRLVIILVGPFFVIAWIVFLLYVAAIHRRWFKRSYSAALVEDCTTLISMTACAMVAFFELIDVQLEPLQLRCYDQVPVSYWIVIVGIPLLVTLVIAYLRRSPTVAVGIQFVMATTVTLLLARRILIRHVE